MIFYFTGTGNSLDIAQKMLNKEELLIDIAKCIKNDEYKFKLGENEKLGFIFPVYFYNVPKIVEDFISKLEVSNPTYTYSIITCGGGIAQAANVLFKLLSARNIKLNYASELLMPDNAMIYYGIDSQAKNNVLLKSSYEKLNVIKNDINSNKQIEFGGTLISSLIGSMYKYSLSTKKFYVENDKCVSCKICETNCPIDAIKIIGNKPKWVKDECIKCLSCINRCPNKAIQYGKFTKNRHRYINPNI